MLKVPTTECFCLIVGFTVYGEPLFVFVTDVIASSDNFDVAVNPLPLPPTNIYSGGSVPYPEPPLLTAIEVITRRDGMNVLYVAEIDDAIEIVDCLVEFYEADIDCTDIFQKDGTLKIVIK